FYGIPEIQRKSIFNELNQKAVARKAAKNINKAYETTNLIVAHKSGGITVGAHHNGKDSDVNNAMHGDGHFSPESAGTEQAGDMIALCFSGELYRDEVMNKIVGEGGLMAYLQTSDAREVEERIDKGDMLAKEAYEAMAYQIAKE